MNYREPLTKNEIREHAAHYENSNPAVYCGTYAKYNNGSLYGMWIDLSTFENYHDFMEFCNRLHANEAEPELMFQDYEHYPEQWYCEGCMGEATFDKIKEYANLSEERREAYEAYLSNWDEGTLEDFEERYEGKYESPEDFAEYLCEECGYFKNLPQWLQCCIDYSAVWRSLDTGGARSIPVAIIRRSMAISSEHEQSGATRFSFGLRPADLTAGLFSTPEDVVLLHRLRQMTR